MDPEIEFFGPTATVLNEGKCYRGHDGMRRYLRDAEALWEELELEPQKYREVGNHVVVLGRVRARARDGLELDTPAAWVWRVEGGQDRLGLRLRRPRPDAPLAAGGRPRQRRRRGGAAARRARARRLRRSPSRRPLDVRLPHERPAGGHRLVLVSISWRRAQT